MSEAVKREFTKIETRTGMDYFKRGCSYKYISDVVLYCSEHAAKELIRNEVIRIMRENKFLKEDIKTLKEELAE